MGGYRCRESRQQAWKNRSPSLHLEPLEALCEGEVRKGINAGKGAPPIGYRCTAHSGQLGRGGCGEEEDSGPSTFQHILG